MIILNKIERGNYNEPIDVVKLLNNNKKWVAPEDLGSSFAVLIP
jgi:hypothetical protein